MPLTLKERINKISKFETPVSYWESRLQQIILEMEEIKREAAKQIKQAVADAKGDMMFTDLLKPAEELASKVASKEMADFKTDIQNKVNNILNTLEKKKEDLLNKVDERISTQLSDFSQKSNTFLDKIKKTADSLSDKQLYEFGRMLDNVEKLKGPQGIPGESPDPMKVAEITLSKLDKEIPNKTVEKINKATKKVSQESIEGLIEELQSIKKAIRERPASSGGGGGGMGKIIHQQFSGNGSTTAFTLSSNVAGAGTAVFACRYQGQIQYLGDQFTISGKTLTFTFTPADGSTIEITYARA